MECYATVKSFLEWPLLMFLLKWEYKSQLRTSCLSWAQEKLKFLGGVASVKGVKGFNPEAAKKRFFEIYLDKYAKPNSGIGFPGAFELVTECKSNGLKVAVASSADRIKVDANLAAAGLPLSMFDAIVSADAFVNLKPAPDIFLAASKKSERSPK
ncbi:NHL repeat-containing protein 2 [Forsythia ovata]|uniref:NHL repeat-containing protein 2 n=1 Tax=Forsythia ovata TaxID=205694 RepID=A0ABD1VHX8_9LAMI